jgi:hypothetical protein
MPAQLAPPGLSPTATSAERQEAARQSVATGYPLTGIALARLYGRGPRWGTERITEVRSEDIARTARASADNGDADAGQDPSPNGKTGNGDEDDHTEPDLPIGNSRNGDGKAHAGAADRPPINGHDHRLPIGTPADDHAVLRSTRSAGRTPATTPAVWWFTTASVLAVGIVAGIASYDHQRFVAQLAGEDLLAWLLPISVDGLIAAASMSMLVRRRAGEPAGTLAWSALLLGLSASLAANIVAADPDLVDPATLRRVVGAWPPIALGLSFELWLQLFRPDEPEAAR